MDQQLGVSATMAALAGLAAAASQRRKEELLHPGSFSDYLRTRYQWAQKKTPLEAGMQAAQNVFLQSLMSQSAGQPIPASQSVLPNPFAGMTPAPQ